jgi:hypothetical protein
MGLGPFWVEVREDEIMVTEPGTSRVSAVFHMPADGSPTKGQGACKGIYRVQGPMVVANDPRTRLDRIATRSGSMRKTLLPGRVRLGVTRARLRACKKDLADRIQVARYRADPRMRA